MTLPSIAIIGRPNVGKSTLVNRLCQTNDAIVFDRPGVTRDRTYQNASWGGREFQIVDTGGLVFEDDSEFLPEIRTQVFLALEEASLALFVVDGNQGVTDGDLSIAKKLIATLEDELDLYKQKYRDEVDNNEYKTKYRELLDSHWDWKLRQKSMTELNYDGDETSK